MPRLLPVLTLVVLTAMCVPALAQNPPAAASTQPSSSADYPTFEVTGGYQLLHIPDQTFPFGLNIDGAWNPNSALGLVGEVGWAYHSDDENGVDTSTHAWNFGVGPRWTARGSSTVWPYAQVLAGVVHARGNVSAAGLDTDFSDTRFMLQPGAGVNVNVADGLGVVVAADYRRVFLDEDEDGDSGENDFRVFVGLRLVLD
jgi:hypothetical protein